jgi:hypothetical protein
MRRLPSGAVLVLEPTLVRTLRELLAAEPFRPLELHSRFAQWVCWIEDPSEVAIEGTCCKIARDDFQAVVSLREIGRIDVYERAEGPVDLREVASFDEDHPDGE